MFELKLDEKYIFYAHKTRATLVLTAKVYKELKK